MQRDNVRLFRTAFSWNPRPKDFLNIQQMNHDIYYTHFTRLDTGETESWDLYVTLLDWHFKSGDNLHGLIDFNPTYERLFEPFEISPGVLLLPGEYRFTRFRSNLLSTATKRRLSASINFLYGGYWSGEAEQVIASAIYKLPPRLTLSVTTNQTFARLPEGRLHRPHLHRQRQLHVLADAGALQPAAVRQPVAQPGLAEPPALDAAAGQRPVRLLQPGLDPGGRARGSAVPCRGHQDFGQDSVFGALLMPAAATWIDRPDALAAAAARWQAAAADVALDTEFVFERTYRPRLGIVQIAVAGEIALIDAVRIPDLSALGPLLADPARRKLLHSGSGDLPILRRAGGAALRGLLDTQIAAAFAGLGPSLSYAALVKTLLGVELAKHETRTDWLRRPLSPDQLRYAAEDVEYLPAVAADLEERLRVLGRLEWALEDSATLATLDGDTPDPAVAWRRVKGIDRLNRRRARRRPIAGGVARARSRSRSTWRARSCCATKRCWRSPSATRWRRRTPRRCPATTRAATRTRRRAGRRRCRPRAPTSRPGPRRPRIRGRRPTSAIDSRRWKSGSPRWSRSARPSSAWRRELLLSRRQRERAVETWLRTGGSLAAAVGGFRGAVLGAELDALTIEGDAPTAAVPS